jgi:transposase
MARRQFTLSDTQEASLQQAYLRTNDGPTRTRYQAVRLYGLGYPVAQIQEITGCSRTSLLEWCRRYHTDGRTGLVDGRVGGNRAKLTPAQRQTVRASLHQYTPRQLFGPATATPEGQFWSIPDLKRAVQQWFGITWSSPTCYASLLADCDFTYQRPQKVFKSRREREIVAVEQQLEKN